MRLSALEKTVIGQAKGEAVRICEKHGNLEDSLLELEALYGIREDEHFLWFVDFFVRTQWLNELVSTDSFKSLETRAVHSAVSVAYKPNPPDKGSPSTATDGASR